RRPNQGELCPGAACDQYDKWRRVRASLFAHRTRRKSRRPRRRAATLARKARAARVRTQSRGGKLVTESHGTPAGELTGFRGRARGGGRGRDARLPLSAVARGVAAAAPALGVPVRP